VRFSTGKVRLAAMRIRAIGSIALLALVAAGARGDDSAPSTAAARLVPSEMTLLVGVDFAQLRAAGPPATIQLLMDGTRPQLAKFGADPAKVGAVAIGVQLPPGSDGHMPTVLVADVPVDVKLLEKTASGPLTSSTYQGVAIRRDKRDAYAIVPRDRLLMSEGMKIERVIDLVHGKGTALVDKAAASLLARVGATGGQGPALFGWLRADQSVKERLVGNDPVVGGVEEAAASMATGANGADLKAAARCANKDAAAQVATAAREGLAKAARDPTVGMLGLTQLVQAVKVSASDNFVTASLHMTREQYVDLITRLTGFIQQAASVQLPLPVEPTPPPPAAAPAPSTKSKSIKPRKAKDE